jgi:Flp pilus assembly pilin Flp
MPSLKEIYLMPFNALAAAIRFFLKNRGRTKALVRRPNVALIVRYGMLATLLVWLLIAALTRDEDGNRLTDAIKTLWSTSTDSTSQDSSGAEEPLQK